MIIWKNYAAAAAFYVNSNYCTVRRLQESRREAEICKLDLTRLNVAALAGVWFGLRLVKNRCKELH